MPKEEVSEQELLKILHQITTGRKIFEYNSRYIACRFPTHFETELAQMVYDRAFKEARACGIPTREELEKTLYEKGTFTKEEDEKIKDLEDRITAQIELLSKLVTERRIKETEDNIAKMRQELNRMLANRYRYLNISAEAKANEARVMFLVPYCVEDAIAREQFWKSEKEFLNEKDRYLVSLVTAEFIDFTTGFDEHILRKLAKGEGRAGIDWRIRWRAAVKTHGSPFPGPIVDWDINKVRLCYWSAFYDSVWEHPERPDERTIMNDDLLDLWVKKQADEAEARARDNYNGEGKSAYDQDETIIFEIPNTDEDNEKELSEEELDEDVVEVTEKT